MDTTSQFFITGTMIIISIAGFLLFWMGILTLISMMSGWNRLSKKYTFIEKHRPPEKKISFQSARLGISNYNNVLTFYFYPDGIAIEVMILFRIKHPKLYIPWTDIKLKEKSKSIFSWNILEIGNPPLAKISVNTKILQEMNFYIDKGTSEDNRW